MIRLRQSIRLVALVLALVGIAFGSAQAQPATRAAAGSLGNGAPAQKTTKLRNQRARDYLVRGWTYYNKGEWDRAIEEWEKGALVEPNAVWNWNFGQANRQAGRFEKARWNYERFIAEAADISGTEEAIANARRFIEEIDTAANSPPRGPVDEPAPERAPAPQEAAPAVTRVQAEARLPETARWHDDWVGWSVLGVGVFGAAAAGGLFYNAESLEDDARSVRNQERLKQMLDDVKTRREIAVVASVVGAGCIVVGIVKLAIAPRDNSALARAAERVHVGPSWVGVQVGF